MIQIVKFLVLNLNEYCHDKVDIVPPPGLRTHCCQLAFAPAFITQLMVARRFRSVFFIANTAVFHLSEDKIGA